MTKKRVKDPVKQQAGRLGAVIRTHLKQKLLHDLQGRRFEKEEVQHEAPVKVVETPAETNADWSLQAIGAAAGVIGLNAYFKPPPSPPEPAKQIIHKQEIPTQAPLTQTFDLFYMQ